MPSVVVKEWQRFMRRLCCARRSVVVRGSKPAAMGFIKWHFVCCFILSKNLLQTTLVIVRHWDNFHYMIEQVNFIQTIHISRITFN